MSYVLTPFLIDLEQLRKAVGSRDESLLAAVVDASRSPDPDVDLRCEGQVPLSPELRQLVMGDPLDDESGSEYGYALQLLCRHLGQEILPDVWEGVRWAAVVDAGLEEPFETRGAPVRLPDRDFPAIAYLTAEEIAQRISQLEHGHLTSEDRDLQELLDEYEGWLREAASKGKAIVFFYA
jgi:hypothetical protein